MKHYAISSFVPDAPHWCFHWPREGPAQREQVLGGMPDPSLLKVLALPCRHAAHVHWQSQARWVVLEIDAPDFVERDGFVDFCRGVVLFNGPARAACDFLEGRGLPVPHALQVHLATGWENASAGEYGLAVAGVDAIASAGGHGLAYAHSGSAVAGERGIAVALYGEVRAGNRGFALTVYGTHATAGEEGLARADEFGTATAGRGGVAISETGGKAVAGDLGLALARHGSATAISGAGGASFAWDTNGDGKAQAGQGGILLARWDDGSRCRIAVAYVGENGIKPDTPYKLGVDGQFVECAEGVG